MSTEVKKLIEQLSQRLGDDDKASIVIATLSAAWADMAAKLRIAEGKLSIVGGEAATSLQELGSALDELGTQVKESDQQLAELYSQIYDKVSEASQLESKARTAMEDVLKTYQEFSGNVTKLKQGIGGLAKSAIGSVIPGASSILNSKIDDLLGIG